MRSPTSVAALLLHGWVDVGRCAQQQPNHWRRPPPKKKRKNSHREDRTGMHSAMCIHHPFTPWGCVNIACHGHDNGATMYLWPTYVCLTAVQRSKSGPLAKNKVGKNYHHGESKAGVPSATPLTRSPLRVVGVMDTIVTHDVACKHDRSEMQFAAQGGPMCVCTSLLLCVYVPFAPPTHGSHDRRCLSLEVAPRRLQPHDATR